MPQKDKNILRQSDIEKELRVASLEERDVNFRGKVIQSISLQGRIIERNIDLEAAVVLGPVYLGSAIIKGNLNFNEAIIRGAFYCGSAIIKGDLNMEETKINGVVNLMDAKIEGSLNCRGLTVSGFLSLAKGRVRGDVNFYEIKVRDAYQSGLIVKGDVYLRHALIFGNLNLAGSEIEAGLDMLNIVVKGRTNIKSTEIGDVLILKEAKSEKGLILKNSSYKELVK